MYLQLMLLTGVLGMSILLSGCNGARELDQRANVVAMGLDTAEQEGMTRVSYQFAVPQIEAGKDDASKAAVIVTNTAPSLAEGLNLLNSEVALQPVLAHVKVIVVGEELARRGIANVLGPFMRYREYRGSMFVVVTRGTAKNFLEKNKPLFVVSMAKYYEEMITSWQESGYFLQTTLHQYYTRLKNKSGQPYISLIAINSGSGEGEISTRKVPGGKIEGYRAGDLPRSGGNVAEFAGTAIFDGDKMVGTLSTIETRMLAMLLGNYSNGFIVVEDPLEPKSTINVNLHLGSKPKISVVLVEDHPVIHVSILLEGEISSIPSGINYEEESYLDLLEAQVSNVYTQEMMNFSKHTQELNADVAGFGYYLRPAFQSNKEYENYKWNEKYSQAEVNIEVKTQIRRTGLMLRTFPTE